MSTQESSTNTVIAEALAKAGVSSRNIELPKEPVNGNGSAQARKNNLNSDPYGEGQPKGIVQGEQSVETKKTEGEPKTSEAGTPKAKSEQAALSKAEIESAINQASSRFQSIMDRRINQLQAQLQGTVLALNQFFQSQESQSMAGLPKEEQLERRLAAVEKGGTGAFPRIPVQMQQPIESQAVNFFQQLVDTIDVAGLKVDDPRIDWARDTSDPETGRARFLKSIKTALVEDQTKAIESLKAEGNKEIQKVRKKSGIDKVSTHGASGSGNPDFEKMTPFQKLTYAFEHQEGEQ